MLNPHDERPLAEGILSDPGGVVSLLPAPGLSPKTTGHASQSPNACVCQRLRNAARGLSRDIVTGELPSKHGGDSNTFVSSEQHLYRCRAGAHQQGGHPCPPAIGVKVANFPVGAALAAIGRLRSRHAASRLKPLLQGVVFHRPGCGDAHHGSWRKNQNFLAMAWAGLVRGS